jgi:glycosyltransferase involved in cell wall biosynthesis
LQEQGSADGVLLVQAGRLERTKGHEVLLDALAQLIDLPAWRCWQIGGAACRSESRYLQGLRERARSNGIGERVSFLGWRPDASRLIAAADVFCQPNVAPDSFGLGVVEALYAGLPVVASDMGGPAEILDNSCGHLVTPGDAPVLARELRALIESPSLRSARASQVRSIAAGLCEPARRLADLAVCLHDATRQGSAPGHRSAAYARGCA